MAHPATNCNKGFTLIEMMIAILIIMASMLALLTAITTAIRTNRTNELRNAAIRITNQTAESLISLPLDDNELATGITHVRIAGDPTQAQKGIPDTTQSVRNYTFTCRIQWSVLASTADLKQINIQVGYDLATGQSYTNYGVTYKYRGI